MSAILLKIQFMYKYTLLVAVDLVTPGSAHCLLLFVCCAPGSLLTLCKEDPMWYWGTNWSLASLTSTLIPILPISESVRCFKPFIFIYVHFNIGLNVVVVIIMILLAMFYRITQTILRKWQRITWFVSECVIFCMNKGKTKSNYFIHCSFSPD